MQKIPLREIWEGTYVDPAEVNGIYIYQPFSPNTKVDLPYYVRVKLKDGTEMESLPFKEREKAVDYADQIATIINRYYVPEHRR